MKILIVDDHPVLRDGVSALFRHAAADTVVVEAAGVSEGLAMVARHPDIDILLLDLVMPGLGGMPAIAAFAQAREDLPIIVLSSSEDPADIRRALSLGALGYVPKSASPRTLLSAVDLVVGGDLYIPALALEDARSGGACGTPEEIRGVLTLRQLDVLRLVADGQPNKIIAARLKLSDKTVKTHITSIFKALKVINRTQAATVGRRAGLL